MLDSELKLYLGLMVHLEGWSDEMDREDKYTKHMGAALEFLKLLKQAESGRICSLSYRKEDTVSGSMRIKGTLRTRISIRVCLHPRSEK